MNSENVQVHLLLDEIQRIVSEDIAAEGDLYSGPLVQRIMSLFPSVSEEDAVKFLGLISIQYNKITGQSDRLELVGTLPTISKLKMRQTISVIKEMIEDAKESILITGYSITEYSNELLELVLSRSKSGVYVELYINNDEKIQEHLLEVLPNRGRFLKVYKYNNRHSSFSALHAKIVATDKKNIFVSSANLSYNGLIGNIEIGAKIESKKIYKVHEVFNSLVEKKYFVRI